ncbi:MAG: hypothetical protein Q9221_004166 [Calogaya cf. arnoldii]
MAELALVTPADSPSPSKRAKKHTTFGYGQLLPQNAKETMKESFLELHLCKPDEERIPIAPRANSAPSEDYTNVFLSHAHVYVFAEKFDIQPLKRLALKNLHQTLAKFTLWPECVGDIVALARFMYNPMFEPVNEAESMRSILKRYIGYEMDVLIRAADFRDLLEENRELLDDVCSMVGERSNSLGKGGEYGKDPFCQKRPYAVIFLSSKFFATIQSLQRQLVPLHAFSKDGENVTPRVWLQSF